MEVVLRAGEEASFRGLELKLREIIVEEMAPSRDGAYPAGNGVTIRLSLRKNDKAADMTLSLLSEGYESRPDGQWEGFSVHLVDADDRKARLSIR